MPIHDWSAVPANLFHDFHQTWTIRLCDALNGGLLPREYSALVEPHGDGWLSVEGATETVLAARANRIAIRHRLARAVGMIEIVSPGNKSGAAALRSFVKKSLEFLDAGVNLLIVDLFPPAPERDPQGIHKAIWDEIDEQPFELSPDQPLTLAAYVASQPYLAYVQPAGVGEVLPDMPAYLSEDAYVPVPLEATYQGTWASCPEVLRAAVEGRPIGDETSG
jgi:hypothetical protein